MNAGAAALETRANHPGAALASPAPPARFENPAAGGGAQKRKAACLSSTAADFDDDDDAAAMDAEGPPEPPPDDRTTRGIDPPGGAFADHLRGRPSAPPSPPPPASSSPPFSPLREGPPSLLPSEPDDFGIPRVAPETLAAALTAEPSATSTEHHPPLRCLLIDCRFPHEFRAGHVRGATHAPDPADAQRVLAALLTPGRARTAAAPASTLRTVRTDR